MTLKTEVKEIRGLLENVVIPRLGALDSISRKLVEHDARFDRIEAKIDTKLDKDEAYAHFDRICKKFETIDQEYVFIKGSLKRLENNDQVQTSEVKLLDNRVFRLEGKVDDLERSLGKTNN